MRLPRPPVLVITDRRVAARSLENLVPAVLAGGCRWISLREKDLAPDQRRALLGRLAGPVRAAGATLTVHGDLAAAATLDGLHLGRDGDPAAARRSLGRDALIGASAHDLAEAERAQAAGADYVTLSPVFPSLSKPGYAGGLGLAGLQEVTAALSIPVIALGGVSAGNAAACRRAGAAGVALCGAVMMASDPAAALSEVVKAFES